MNSSGRRTVYQVLCLLSPPPQALPALAAAPSGFIPSPLAFGDTGAGPRGQRLQSWVCILFGGGHSISHPACRKGKLIWVSVKGWLTPEGVPGGVHGGPSALVVLRKGAPGHAAGGTRSRRGH